MPRPFRPDAAPVTTRSRRRTHRSDHRFRPSWSPPAETLEIRIVPSADVWTGGGSDNLFSDTGNWQGGAVPQPGDNLDFPATATTTTPHDDLLGVGFGTITIDASGYSIGADSPIVTTGITTTYASGISTISADLTPTGAQTTPVTVAVGGTLELSGSIGGTSGLTLSGGGTLLLDGTSANTDTGTAVALAGELRLSKPDGIAALAGPLVVGDSENDIASVQDEANNQLGAGIAVTVFSGSTLALYGHNDSIGVLSLQGGSVTAENAGTDTFGELTLDGPVAADATSSIYGYMTLGADLTFTVAPAATLTLDGPIDGQHGLTLGYSQTFPDTSVHAGGGTVLMKGTMSGPTANAYTGATTIQYGTLQLAKPDGVIAISASLTISDPVSNAATVQDEANGQLGSSAAAAIFSGGLLDLNGHNDAVTGLVLLGSGDATLVQTGAGTLALGGYIADDSTSTLTVTGNVRLTANTTVTVVPGGVVDLNAAIGDDGNLRSLTLAPSQTLPDSTIHLGGGTLEFSGTADNTYTGTTTAAVGVLQLDMGSGAIAVPGPLTIGDSFDDPASVVDLADGQLNHSADATVNLGGVLQLNGFNDAVSTLDLNGGTATTGAGVLTINNEVYYEMGAAAPTLLAANLNLAADVPVFYVPTGQDLVVQGVISGGGFQLRGGGTVELWGSTAPNTYTGTTEVYMGTLLLDNAPGTVAVPGDLVIGTGCAGNIVKELQSGQVAATSHVTIGDRSMLNLWDVNQTIAGLTMNGGTVLLGGGALTLNGDVTATGSGEIDNNRYMDSPNVNNEPEGRLDLGGARAFNVSGGVAIAINALVTDGSVIKGGLGELELTDTNDNYTGFTQVNAGELYVNGWNTLAQTSGATVNNGAMLILDGVNTYNLAITLGGGAGTADSTLNVYNSQVAVTPSNPVNTITNLVLDGDATVNVEDKSTETIDGLSTGNMVNHRLTVGPNGTVRLVGQVTNDGPFVVNGGILDVASASFLTGAVTVSPGGHLGGAASIGAVTSTGGTVGAISNDSPQVLTVASLTLDAGSNFAVDINGNTPGSGGYDQVVSQGAVSLGGANLSINRGNYTPQAGDRFTIIRGASTPTGAFNGLAEGSLIQAGGYSFRISYAGGSQGHDVVMSYVQASTTTLSTSSFISTWGQTVNFTATVTAVVGTPTGSVTFTEGSAVIGTVALGPQGTAALPLSNLSVGYHTIVATYSGAAGFTSSSSTTQGQVIKQTATTTTLGLSATPITVGQSETLTATVSPAAGSGMPTGSVTFYDGSTSLGSVSLNAATASLTIGTFGVGPHVVTVVYAGDVHFIGGTSSASALGVNRILTSTLLGGSATSVVFGQQVMFSAYVGALAPASGNPSGSVTFYDGTNSLGTSTNINGWATLSTSSLGIGGHALTAVYSGNATTAGSHSLAFSEVVTPDSATTTLASSAAQAVFGQSVTLTASVAVISPGTATPSGRVTFMDGSNVLGTRTLTNGKATFATTALGLGHHDMYAIYGGNESVFASSSPAIAQNVAKASTGTGFVSSAQVATFGQMVTYSAAVAAVAPGGGTPTGLLSFYDGTALIGTAELSGGTAKLTVRVGGVGSHPITVTYSGDTNFNGSVSGTVTETVNKANPRTTAFARAVGTTVFIPVSVQPAYTGAATPTGTVTFFANSKKIGQATLLAGTASIIVPGRGILAQSVTIFYSGDANYAAATFASQIFSA